MKKAFLKNTVVYFIPVLTGLTNAFGKADTATKFYEQLSLKDLQKVKLVSVSKQSEMLFDAPLYASVISPDT